MKEGWKKEAEEKYFVQHKKIGDIAEDIGVTRKYVSAHLSGCQGYREEKERRKQENLQGRKEYKRDWDSRNRSYAMSVTADSMKREHDLAVMELSHERY